MLLKNYKNFTTLECSLQKLPVVVERQIEKSSFFFGIVADWKKILSSRLKTMLSKLLWHMKAKTFKYWEIRTIDKSVSLSLR